MLVLARKSGESILIGEDIEIVVKELRPSCVRLAIAAPREVTILRAELVGPTGTAQTKAPHPPMNWLGRRPDIRHDNHTEVTIMAKCHYSGVNLPLDKMKKLDIPQAKAEIHQLRSRLNKLEEIVEELSEMDDHVVEDDETGQERTVKRFRLVTEDMAEVLAQRCGVSGIFEPFMDWLEEKRASQKRHKEYHDG